MGEGFTKWVLAEIQDQGKNNFAISFVVHTHPVGGTTNPSSKVLHTKIGDKPGAKEVDRDGVIVTKNRIGVYNDRGRYCEYDRTPSRLSAL